MYLHIINIRKLQIRRKKVIQEEFVKENKIKDKTQEELNTALVQNIIETNNNLQNSINNYGYAEGEMIDYYLYQIKANQSKLNYLIKEAKDRKILIDRATQISLRNTNNYNVV